MNAIGSIGTRDAHAASAPALALSSCLQLNTNDHNWWTTIGYIREKTSAQSGAEKIKIKKPEHHFQVTYVHIYIYIYAF